MALRDLIYSGFTRRQAALLQDIGNSGEVIDTTARAAAATAQAAINAIPVDVDVAVGPQFRGLWGPLTVLHSYDFNDSLIPAGFERDTWAVVSNIGGSGAPPHGRNVSYSGTSDGKYFKLNSVPAGVTQLKYYATATVDTNASTSGLRVRVSGATVNETSGNMAWTDVALTVAAGNSVEWDSISGGLNVSVWIGLIELLGASAPYMRGDAVVYAGSLYTSAVDNNGSTPEANGDWTKLLIGTVP